MISPRVKSIGYLEKHPKNHLEASIKIRYKAHEVDGLITPQEEDGTYIKFTNPLRDITPGQAAVFYHDEVCLGGGIINLINTNGEYKICLKKRIFTASFAVDCFNGTWDLIEKTNRTPDDDTRMIHMAHASRYHWGEIGTPLNFARGDWQISRVYAILGQGGNALKYAKSCVQLCIDNQFGDFDLAFAYEAAARAYAVLGDTKMVSKHLDLAKEAGQVIEKEEDRKYFFSELGTVSMD